MQWVESLSALSIAKQCCLVSVTRSVVYNKKKRLQEEMNPGTRLALHRADQARTSFRS
ncbi:hypothetical protein [Undibacterium sp. CCC3.4]|uniref:hypothetical protein n=1 Tax=Undibacterium sp. CCC3.4 TaxID=3048609 RepID=UPI002AC968B3|nr:hypothetical protein [Undibacterium sp. CCC3.4]WPX44582.1 hypothetical protein RHM61_04960 [Undibacterium sp. CCC3.4]